MIRNGKVLWFLVSLHTKDPWVKKINSYLRDHQDQKTWFDLVTPSDEAYAMFVYMNGYNYWVERIHMKILPKD